MIQKIILLLKRIINQLQRAIDMVKALSVYEQRNQSKPKVIKDKSSVKNDKEVKNKTTSKDKKKSK